MTEASADADFQIRQLLADCRQADAKGELRQFEALCLHNRLEDPHERRKNQSIP